MNKVQFWNRQIVENGNDNSHINGKSIQVKPKLQKYFSQLESTYKQTVVQQAQTDYSYMGYNYKSTLNKQLDPRDQIIQIPFLFSIPELSENKHRKWAETRQQQIDFQEPDQLVIFKQKLANWIIAVIDIVTSVTFNHLRRQNLTQNEGKAFCAKNILSNIKKLCYLCRSFSEQNRLKLNIFIDNHLQSSISAIIHRYPQTSSKGASQRVRRMVRLINNRQSDEYDFLSIHGLNFYYKDNGDYSSQILQTLNKIITIGNQTDSLQSENTFFEEYQEFCERIVQLVPDHTIKYQEYLPKKPLTKKLVEKVSCSSDEVLAKVKLEQQKQDFYRFLINKILSNKRQIQKGDGEILELRQKDSKIHLKTGQKIPSWVPPFTENQVKLGKFKSKNPSVLRVLTKWGEELLEQIQDSQHEIRCKIQKFKTNQGDLVFLTAQQRQALSTAVKMKQREIQSQLQCLKQQNKILQSRFACEYSKGRFIERDTDVGVYAAKLQEIVGQYVFKFVNKVIHLLLGVIRDLEASWNDLHATSMSFMKEDSNDSKVNLVTFKIGDIFRSRYSCKQVEFINILQLLYQLDEQNPNYFKLVRIKNRLDQKDNDILINYLFKKKILCQLQLSILGQESKKQYQYSSFNHFLYELKRAQFGPLSELACIATSYDPVISSFAANSDYCPELIPINTSKSFYGRSSMQITPKSPFICTTCGKLKQIFNPQFYDRRSSQNVICNECLQVQVLMNEDRKNSFLLQALKQSELQISFNILENISWFKPESTNKSRGQKTYLDFLKKGLFVDKNSKKPQIKFFKSVISAQDNKLILSTLDKNGQISNFEKIDILSKKNNFLKSYLFFNFPEEDSQFLQEIFLKKKERGDILTFKSILDKQNLEIFITTLKSNEQILYLSGRTDIISLCERYFQCDNKYQSKRRKQMLIDLNSHIKYIQLQNCGITQINNFALSKFKSIVQLNLSCNNIASLSNYALLKKLKVGQFFTNLIESNQSLETLLHLKKLNLSSNMLQSISGIEKLAQLTTLDLSNNKLTSVSSAINDLQNLQWLSLKDNKIENYPKLKLLQLETLNLSNNCLSAISHCSLPKLKLLQLSGNKIEKLQNLSRLAELSALYINKNKLKTIENIQKLSKLEILHINYNEITNISQLAYLQRLTILWAKSNQIQQISVIDNLKELRKVNFQCNKITNITAIKRIHYFDYINLKGNPIGEVGHQIAEIIENSEGQLRKNIIQTCVTNQ